MKQIIVTLSKFSACGLSRSCLMLADKLNLGRQSLSPFIQKGGVNFGKQNKLQLQIIFSGLKRIYSGFIYFLECIDYINEFINTTCSLCRELMHSISRKRIPPAAGLPVVNRQAFIPSLGFKHTGTSFKKGTIKQWKRNYFS